jgi:gas vesicle protein
MTQTDAGTGEQVKDKATEVAGQAQEKAQQAAGQARDQMRTQIDQRSTDAGRKVSEQGGDLRAVGDQLREQGKDGPAKLADQAAHHVERAGSWLSESDGDKILHDIEDAARKNPWAVAAGGLALGFAASRLLKASSSDRYQARGAQSGGATTPPGTATPDRALPRPTQPGDTLHAGEPRFGTPGAV